jgi:hypothetical protein
MTEIETLMFLASFAGAGAGLATVLAWLEW